MTKAEIVSAFNAELGDAAAALTDDAVKARWFNEGQARLEWYTHDVLALTWAAGDVFVPFGEAIVGVVEVLYPEGAQETRWRPAQGGLVIEDYDGAQYAGDCKVLARAYWPEVSDSQASLLPRVGDAACLAYALHRFFRRAAADRSVFERYATLTGENGVTIDDLGDLADDHYRDFLDLRNDLPVEPPAPYFGG